MRILAVIWAVAGRTGADDDLRREVPALDGSRGGDRPQPGRPQDILFALEGRTVTEVLPPVPVRPLPAVAPWVRGMATVRGASIVVVDARMLLGFESRPPSTRNRLVVVPMPPPHDRRQPARNLGLWVDAVIDVRPIDFGAAEAHPGVAPASSSGAPLAPELLGPLGPTPWGLAQLIQPRQLFDDAGWAAIASRLEEAPA